MKASNTANIVHVHTQNLIGNANSTGFQVTSKARSVGAALTGLSGCGARDELRTQSLLKTQARKEPF